MTMDDALEIAIVGMIHAGRAVRPSDWAERMSGMMSVFGEGSSSQLFLLPQAGDVAGRALCGHRRPLESMGSAAYRFLLDFAQDNELNEPKLQPGRTRIGPEEAPTRPEQAREEMSKP